MLANAAPSSADEVQAGDGVQIVNGDFANIADHPWLVALVFRAAPDAFVGQVCGGSLIDPFWVLTAAHCVDGVSTSALEVVSGIGNLKKATDQNTTRVAELIAHPDFILEGSPFLDNDVALVRLESPIENRELLVLNRDQDSPLSGASATLAGWGRTSEQGRASKRVRSAVLPVLSNPGDPTCSAYESWDYHPGSMLCAGDLPAGTSGCFGDSGGPLVADEPDSSGSSVQIGIVSWGEECGSGEFGSVFTRVSTYVPWIFAVMGSTEGCDIVGTEGDDILVGTDANEVICGLGGNDVIRGRRGNDVLIGGPGDDRLLGGSGNDQIFGDRGNDTLIGGPGHDFIEGSAGNDILKGVAGLDTLRGGNGADVIRGGRGRDAMAGDRGRDVLLGGRGADVIFGLGGNDKIDGGPGFDVCILGERLKNCEEV